MSKLTKVHYGFVIPKKLSFKKKKHFNKMIYLRSRMVKKKYPLLSKPHSAPFCMAMTRLVNRATL
jgi:hypothetical protein